MMVCLLGLMIVLAVRSLLLKGGEDGIKFYLFPDFKKLTEGSGGLWEAVYAAMGQSFFTLSLGIGALAIFGSYIGKERSLTGEALSIAVLDTFVALMAGLIIFPACFAYDIQPDSGPNLIFITLPNVFNTMNGGRLWGSLFFLFMSFAAFSTIIAVFENILSFAMDLTGCSRTKAVVCKPHRHHRAFHALRTGLQCVERPQTPRLVSVLDFEDFLVSNNLLPLRQPGLPAVLHQQVRLGLQEFHERSQHRRRPKIPQMGKILCELYSSGDCARDLLYGVLEFLPLIIIIAIE